MKYIITALTLLLIALRCRELSPTREADIREFINNQYTPATVLMYGGDEKSKNFHCTATAFQRINTGYFFVGAAHCVVREENVYLSLDTSTPAIYYKAKVLAYGDMNSDLDYSVLYVSAPANTFTTVDLGHDPEQPGESILSISAPDGIGKAVLRGTVSMLAIPHDNWIDDGGYHENWKGTVLYNMPGSEKGSSGSSLVCEDQMKICAIAVGQTKGGRIAEPIVKFEHWWDGVRAGQIAPYPPPPSIPHYLTPD